MSEMYINKEVHTKTSLATPPINSAVIELTVHPLIKRTPLPPSGKASGAAGACEEGLTVAVTILYHSERSVGHYHPFPLVSPHQFLGCCSVSQLRFRQKKPYYNKMCMSVCHHVE